MPIIGFNFDKILVQRKKNINKHINVKNDLSIKNITKYEIPIEKTKDNTIKFDFEFSSLYEPNIGEIVLNGHIIYHDNTESIKEILNTWDKKKTVKKELMTTILNTALIKSNIKALMLSQDVNLPPHLRLPLVKPNLKDQKPEDYIG